MKSPSIDLQTPTSCVHSPPSGVHRKTPNLKFNGPSASVATVVVNTTTEKLPQISAKTPLDIGISSHKALPPSAGPTAQFPNKTNPSNNYNNDCVASFAEFGISLSQSRLATIKKGYNTDRFCLLVRVLVPSRDYCTEVDGLLFLNC
ncbi:hypothetical protein KEM48_008245 [Puccinia striiformis f. sp. tritici PST-130]|uniref:Uncharacterized protein n=1 Tax=Puccinia striiformis f. sp. tritici PST-78 TaxID=1165861 RepID=A0A0L0W566_9BASI|nr:hypothetical protein KEM48_008245 [Puccinia striiformis f. sp. tritici PST-130]KNF06678.1 hypothetical protein PSTG_00553 [Puccinia striiformis f. sp. tritici PST-78]